MPTSSSEIGNFIDALLESLESLAMLEEVYMQGETARKPAADKQRTCYIALEDAICDFEHKTGVSAVKLLKKWNNANGPQA